MHRDCVPALSAMFQDVGCYGERESFSGVFYNIVAPTSFCPRIQLVKVEWEKIVSRDSI